MKFKNSCLLVGEGTSVIGDKAFEIDYESKKIRITDTGGLFGEKLDKNYPIHNCTLLGYVSEEKLELFFDTPDKISGNCSLDTIKPELLNELSKNSPLPVDFDKDTSVSSLFYEIAMYDRKDEHIELLDEQNAIICYSIRSTPNSISFVQLSIKKDLNDNSYKKSIKITNELNLHFSKINNVSILKTDEDESFLEIKSTFRFKNNLVSSIYVRAVPEKQFFSSVLKNWKLFQSSPTASINSSIFKIIGNWGKTKFDKITCDVQFHQEGDITIRVVDSDSNKHNIKMKEIDAIDTFDNIIILNGQDNNILLLQTDLEFINAIFEENLNWIKLRDLSKLVSSNGNKIIALVKLETKKGKTELPAVIDLSDDNMSILHRDGKITINLDSIENSIISDNNSHVDFTIKFDSRDSVEIGCSNVNATKMEYYLIKQNVVKSISTRKYEYRHPDELLNLANARKSFVANDSIKQMYEKIQEPTTIPDFVGKTVIIDEDQYPNIWEITKHGCQLLDIPVPEIYVYDSFFYKIDSEGLNNPRLEITSKMIEDFSESELRFAIGSSLAHIALNHLEPEVIMEGIINLIPQINQIPGIGGILKAVKALDVTTMLLKIKYYRWSRTAILSADRFGYLFSGSLADSTNVIMKLILNSPDLVSKVSIRKYLKQVERLNTIRGIAAFYTQADESIPYGTDRLLNIFRFANSPLGQFALSKINYSQKS